MLSTLITSRTRRELLLLFLTHPEKRFYQSQLIKQLSLPSSQVQKELNKLLEIGFIKAEREANVKYLRVNKTFPLYGELKSIVYKTIGLADNLKQNLTTLGDVSILFIYGSVARNTEDVNSDIDLMVIGDPDMDELSRHITSAEKRVGREINFTVFTPEDWQSHVREKKGFVTTVLKDAKIFLIGDEVELRKTS